MVGQIILVPHGQVRGEAVIRSAQLTLVPSLETLLCLVLSLDTVALAVTPAVAGPAGHDQLPILVALLTQRTLLQTVARTAGAVLLKPGAVGAGAVGPAVLTHTCLLYTSDAADE